VKFVRLAIAVLILAVVAVLSLRTPLNVHRFWSSVPSRVSFDGNQVHDAKVLLGTVDSAFDTLLLDSRQRDGVIYVVNLSSRQVSEVLAVGYLNASAPPAGSALKPLAVTDVLIEEWRAEFTTPKGVHIRIQWTANM
jgi:hypothetical protein